MQDAKIYQFPDPPEGEAREHRGPQVEDGYTRIANELYENIMAAPLTLREMRVVMAVIRLTYGWNRKQARATGGLLAKLTGMPSTKASATLASLVEKNVITRHGGSRSPVSINKHAGTWILSQPERVTPQPKKKGEIYQSGPTQPKRYDCDQNGKSECDQNGNASKDRKDITSTDVEERIGKPKREASASKKSDSLPTCPHMEILDLWAEIMPDKPQPAKTMWQGTERARHLAARWKAGFTLKNTNTGEPLYTDRESGIAWWGRFFAFLRKSPFLMGDNRWFKLAWVVKKENFVKIMELAYHDGGES